MQAIVLAGGSGSRLRCEVPGIPKPLAPVHERPFLEHLLSYWMGQGIRSFILATGFGAEAIERHFGRCWRGAGIACSREEAPLGTGGAFLKALKLARAEEPLLVLNGDSWADLDLRRFLTFHGASRAEVTIAGTRVADAGRFGAIQREPGTSRVTGIARNAGGDALVSCGAFLFDGEVARSFRAESRPMPLDLEGGVLAPLLTRGHCHAYEHDGAFIDIGTPDDFRRAGDVIGRRGFAEAPAARERASLPSIGRA